MDQALLEFHTQLHDMRNKRQILVAAASAVVGGFVTYVADQIHQRQLLNIVAEQARGDDDNN